MMPNDKFVHRIRNDGPQDLASVRVFRPEPNDRIIYRLYLPDVGGDAVDDVKLGPLRIGE